MSKKDDKITVVAGVEVDYRIGAMRHTDTLIRFDNAWAYAMYLPDEARPIRISFIGFARTPD